VATRDWHSTVSSQIRSGHAINLKHAIKHIHYAYFHIFNNLNSLNIPYITFSYEAMILDYKNVISISMQYLELPNPEIDESEIFNANIKHYV